MLSTILMVVLVLAVGSSLSDRLRLKQEEIILHRLPTAEASAYFDQLRRRARHIRLLRAVALLSLVAIAYAYKQRLTGRHTTGVPPSVPAETTGGTR